MFRTLGGRQHHRRPDRSGAPGGRLVGHAQQRYAGADRPVRRRHQLRRDREPVDRLRPTWSAPTAVALDRRPVPCRGAPSMPRARCASARSTAAATRPTTCTTTRSLTRDGSGALVHAAPVVSTAAPTRRPATAGSRRTVDPDFPFATAFLGDYTNIAVVPRHDPRRRVLDGPARAGLLPGRRLWPRRGCVLRLRGLAEFPRTALERRPDGTPLSLRSESDKQPISAGSDNRTMDGRRAGSSSSPAASKGEASPGRPRGQVRGSAMEDSEARVRRRRHCATTRGTPCQRHRRSPAGTSA